MLVKRRRPSDDGMTVSTFQSGSNGALTKVSGHIPMPDVTNSVSLTMHQFSLK